MPSGDGDDKEHAQRSEKEAGVKDERANVRDALREDILATPPARKATGQAHQQPWRTEPEIEVERQAQLIRCLATIPDISRGIYPFKGMKLSRADVEWLLAAHEDGRDPGARGDERQKRRGLDLRGADLRYADLHALPQAHLEGTRLSRAQIEEARLKKASQSGEQHIGPSLTDAQWGNVNLAVVQWSQVDMLGDEFEARQTTRAGKRKTSATRLEEYEVAVRAQGLDEEAARFAYRAQLLQRIVLLSL